MKRVICISLIFCLIFGGAVSVSALEEGAMPSDYEYVNDAERDFVENVLSNPKYNEYNDTSVFEGRKTYLLQENFIEDYSPSHKGNSSDQAAPAGWDVDRRGGEVISDSSSLHIYDSSETQRVYMTHDIMPTKSGDVTLETAFTMQIQKYDGYFIEVKGDGKTALRLETYGDNLCYVDENGKLVAITKYAAKSRLPIKAVFHIDNKTVDIFAGQTQVKGIAFAQDCAQVDNISLGTSVEGQVCVQVHFVHMYINYIVNERFLTTDIGKTPIDWQILNNGKYSAGVVATQSQRSDTNSYSLSTSSVLAIPRLTKHYNNDNSKLITEFYMLVPKKNDGISAQLLCGNDEVISLEVKGNDFVLNGSTVLYEDFYSNFWYRFKFVTDTDAKTADVYVNFQKYAENVPLNAKNKINGIEFTSGKKKGNSVLVDDINVYPDLPLPTGYPSEPRTVVPDKNIKEVGMLMYSMWREGLHFGWDRISPLEERMPYQGYYTEGEGETADWAIKWQKEHGITYQIYTWSGVGRTEDAPIKKPIRSQAWLEGLGNAQFDMQYCLMWSTPTEQSIRGLNDFKNNILPFWVEYCWKNPRYKRINNKFLLYTYAVGKIRDFLGGDEAMDEAIAMMNEEAKKLGADGVTFVAVEDPSFSDEEAKALGMYRYQYSWVGGSASNGEVLKAETAKHMEKGDFRDYIPSVPMGYEDSPWRTKAVGGFMTIKEINDILTYINDNSVKWKEMGNTATDSVVLTCWDEWGEGHYWCPSRTYGFGYLNAVRNSLTTKGELTDEQLPTKQSYARMNVLYPIGRQALKLMKDMRETDPQNSTDVNDMTLLQKIDFSDPNDFARAQEERSVSDIRQENGMLAFECHGGDPQVLVNDISIPAETIKAVRIVLSTPESGKNILYYQTTDDTDMGVRGKRFETNMVGGSMQTQVFLPADRSKLTGTLTRLRIDPTDTAVGTMYVKSIEIYGRESDDMFLEVDGAPYDLITPLQRKNDTVFMSIYQYFNGHLLVPGYWYRSEGRLHIEYDGKTIELYDGEKDYYINGSKHSFSQPAYYNDGNFYVPVNEFFKSIGYKTGWNDEKRTVMLFTPQYFEASDKDKDPVGVWTFSKNGSTNGWKVDKNGALCTVKDGNMSYYIMANIDSAVVMQNTGLSLKASDYKTLTIRVKNESNANGMRFYYMSDTVKKYGLPNGLNFAISSGDKNYKEYTVDLTKVTGYGGTISALRLDFTGGSSGKVFIDEIFLSK